MRPPDQVVEDALYQAWLSPCAKSKRGAVVYLRRRDHESGPQEFGELVIGVGYNGPPGPFAECDGSASCRALCNRRCVHAESRAIRGACEYWDSLDGAAMSCDLVHAKLGPDGVLVAGGPPSCWQCSREILDVGLGGVWLYEAPDPNLVAAWNVGTGLVGQMSDPVELVDKPRPAWRRYTAAEFHRQTTVNTGGYR